MRGLGCMRLTDHDKERAVATIHAALASGVRLFDTADVYFGKGGRSGDNERLVAQALGAWTGNRSELTVATKGGLVRKGARWIPDGRAKHLQQACEASLEALDASQIELYQLHAVDPKTPLATSLRALARLQDAGLVRSIGLCNVRLDQLRQAETIAPIATVQVALNPLNLDSLRNGVAEYCRDRGIQLIAHTPLGGSRRIGALRRHPAVFGLAEQLGATPETVSLAWLQGLAENITTIPGATRPETASVALPELSTNDQHALDRAFPASVVLRVPRQQRRPADDAEGDVVVLMGCPGAGKSEAAERFVDSGYARLNRDTEGGSLSALAARLDETLATGQRRVVLDNTYPARSSRNEVIEAAWRHGVPARCVWATTALEQAQVNAVERMLKTFGRLLEPDEMATQARTNPDALAPQAQFRYRRELEAPELEEGWVSIEEVPFTRRPYGYSNRALILEHDVISAERRETITRYRDNGFIVLGLGWYPKLGKSDEPQIHERIEATLGFPIDSKLCLHEAGPPKCWCRKPLPGRGVALIHAHQLDPARCLHVGRGASDRTFAERLGFDYIDADGFDASAPPSTNS